MTDNVETIGVIGGSGLYQMEGLTNIERVSLDTPFGAPSDEFVCGQMADKKMIFLPRHGSGHKILPSEINFKANIWGLKKLGVSRIISVSAVGSMREDIHPGDLVLVDQFFDWTRKRPMSFLGDGIVGHVSLAHPVSIPLHDRLVEVGDKLEDLRIHPKGTYICIEGPQFSTRAESIVYRSWGMDVIGMTNMPEARLAREAEIAYTTIALATDYDCWKEDEAHVETEAVLEILRANVEKARRLLAAYVSEPLEPKDEAVAVALRTSLVTSLDAIPQSKREELAPILDPIFAAR